MRLANWLSLTAFSALCAVPVALAAPPYTFTAGAPIRAAEINANFSALDARLTALETAVLASQTPAPQDLLRVSAALAPGMGPLIFLTVPSNASRPYVLRQISTDTPNAVCWLQDGGGQIPFMGNNAVISVLIPFAANAFVSINCPPTGAPPPQPLIHFTFVFAK